MENGCPVYRQLFTTAALGWFCFQCTLNLLHSSGSSHRQTLAPARSTYIPLAARVRLETDPGFLLQGSTTMSHQIWSPSASDLMGHSPSPFSHHMSLHCSSDKHNSAPASRPHLHSMSPAWNALVGTTISILKSHLLFCTGIFGFGF